MATTSVESYCKQYADLKGIRYSRINTGSLKLKLEGVDSHNIVSPQENLGPIVARMEANSSRGAFMEVEPREQSLRAKISITENGLKGINKELYLPGPAGSGIVSGVIPVHIGRDVQEFGPVNRARARLNSNQSSQETCVRLKEAELETEFDLNVSVRGSVIFESGKSVEEVPFTTIIAHLQSRDVEMAKRFHVHDPQKVYWTVRGRCFYYLISA